MTFLKVRLQWTVLAQLCEEFYDLFIHSYNQEITHEFVHSLDVIAPKVGTKTMNVLDFKIVQRYMKLVCTLHTSCIL